MLNGGADQKKKKEKAFTHSKPTQQKHIQIDLIVRMKWQHDGQPFSRE